MLAARTSASRLGVRHRVVLGFGALALLPSLLLAVVVWTFTSAYLLQQREATTLVQAQVNARALQRGLLAAQTPVPRLLGQLPETAATSLVTSRGRWYSSVLTVGPDTLPDTLRDLVAGGSAAQQRVTVDGRPRMVVGVPLPAVDGAYFGLFSLAELDATFRVLSGTLAASTAATTLLGLAMGRFASRRALRPLTEITDAAAAIARGDLDVRLPATRDPDLVTLTTSFNDTADALRRRVVADARFAGDVSHELRTPLTTMLNSVQLLANRRAELPEPAQEIVDLLADDLGRFRHLVTDLLEISRDDSGGDDDVRELVRIGELVCRAADGTAGRPVTAVDPNAAHLLLEVDKRRLAQVITNLVGNAERHGRGCLRVQVTARAGAVSVTVDDAGPGVPPDLRERIFERFARADRDPGEGVGLGLAIVARHVHWHGGTVEVHDRPGGGARFVVELPT